MEVVIQPDGKFAVWSSEFDDFVVWDATADEIDTFLVESELAKLVPKLQELSAHNISKAFSNKGNFKEYIEKRKSKHGFNVGTGEGEKEFAEYLSKWEEING